MKQAQAITSGSTAISSGINWVGQRDTSIHPADYSGGGIMSEHNHGTYENCGCDKCTVARGGSESTAPSGVPESTYVLTAEKIKPVWAALLAMAGDIHSGQDNLSEADWTAADAVLADLTQIMEARRFLEREAAENTGQPFCP